MAKFGRTRYVLNPRTGELEELNPNPIRYAVREIIVCLDLNAPCDPNFFVRELPGMNVVNGRALRGEKAPAVPFGTVFYPDSNEKNGKGEK